MQLMQILGTILFFLVFLLLFVALVIYIGAAVLTFRKSVKQKKTNDKSL